MDHRPAKRQRRSTVVLSDDEQESSSPPLLPLRTSSKSNAQLELRYDSHANLTLSPTKPKPAKAGGGRPVAKASPKSSPEKARRSTKLQKETEKTKSLHNFFSKATDEERWRKRSGTPEVDLELGDAIEDDELSDNAFLEFVEKDPAGSIVDRPPSVAVKAKDSEGTTSRPGPSSQRFAKPALTSKRTGPACGPVLVAEDEDARPWAIKYGPSTVEELAVHKKKVADVQKWLEAVMTGQNGQKLLVLKGPAGSGKTTTISLLAKAMDINLVFWQNPLASDSGAASSLAVQFDEFLSRGGQFGTLLFDEPATDLLATQTEAPRKVLVVEEFPTTMTRSSNTLESFRSVLQQFLSRNETIFPSVFRNQPRPTVISPPAVMIISETLLTSSTALTDSFTAHRLLGPEILNHPLVSVMEFNPVAPTFIAKALDLVIKKEARDSRRRRVPGPAVIQRLAEIGDVRSAVNSLEFLCLRGDNGSDWSGTVAAMPKRTNKDGVPLTEMEKNSLQLLSQREATLDMFHAAGKVVYNKREDPRVQDTRAEPPPKPPDHLMHLYTPKASQVDIAALLNETGTDIQTYISTLHENYVLSCNGDSFVDAIDGCADTLSSSDVLNPDSRRFRRSKISHNAAVLNQAGVQSSSTDALRQDEISFHLATRGLLFSLPHPVNRAVPSSGRKTDAFKMFYPSSLRLWKPTEEIDSLISLFVHDHGAPRDTKSISSSYSAGQGVASWRSRVSNFDTVFGTTSNLMPSSDDPADHIMRPPRPGAASRHVLVLETLPYMTKILAGICSKQEGTDSSVHTNVAARLKLLMRITKFQYHGLPMPSSDEPCDEDNDTDDVSFAIPVADAAAITTTDQRRAALPVPLPTRIVSAMATTSKASYANKTQQDLHMDKLYISDDDIQDD